MTKKEIRQLISSNIRAERARANLTCEQVANAIGVARETYNRYETEASMSVDTLVLIAKLFKCSVDNFYLGLNFTDCEEE